MKKGFTLVELLVVVLIIGILAAVAAPKYTRSVRRAEMIEGLTNGKTIFDAAIRYKAVNSEPPTSFDQIDVGFIGAENVQGSIFNDVNFKYVLTPEFLVVESTREKYFLRMHYPRVEEGGVFAPIYCCPRDGGDPWICTNAAATKTPVNNCYEIK
ncbi:MAG: prepilin-type N-terminal cleavage/methylation domain-containing protein [Elusimicrobiaceae bacterium]|nr:prepilin-type N-terminal cleavage/methylation domain-containing protein [Elusimicrobiaceae bacterium]